MAGFAKRRRGTAMARRWERTFLHLSRQQTHGGGGKRQGIYFADWQCSATIRGPSGKSTGLPLRRDARRQTLPPRHIQRRKLRASRPRRQLDRGLEAMTLPAGTRLSRYEIRSHLGAGAMGEVYLADDTSLHRKVALKILPADLASNQDRMRRFYPAGEAQ